MSAPRPRIALLGMHLESNAFAPVTTEADFRASCYLEGEAMLAEAAKPAPAMPAEIPGFIAAMDASGPWEPVPILITACEPGGPAAQAFIDATYARLRTLLAQAGPLDGIYVCNHGAMTATGDPDPDGALYALARATVGPERLVIASGDLHANISQRMVQSVDAIVSYRTNPHVDQRERAMEAAHLLRRLLAGERFEKTFTRFDELYRPEQIIEVDAAGLTSPMLERYPWQALARPVWPLDAHTQWTPPSIETL